MSSTLIIRDATLAILGPPQPHRDPAERIRLRIAEAQAFEPAFLADCLEVLAPQSGLESSDAEALEATLIACLARPELAAQRGLSPIAIARRLAALTEQSGAGEKALALLQWMVETHPGHKALERDLAASMRRQGMVAELVERYIERAQQLLAHGRTSEAVSWMREVLVLDRSRKDVARTIRDLRFQEVDRVERRRSRRRVALVTLVGSVLISAGVLREKRLAEEYRALPEAPGGDLVGLRERLDGIEAFVGLHPVWHGSLRAIAERTDLRLQVDRLEETRRLGAERRAEELARRLDDADLAQRRGAILVRDGDYAGALEELRNALRAAPPGWPERERVERDIEAISAYLEGRR